MLTTTINKVLHEGNGAATEFSFSFPILTEETLKLYLVDTNGLTTKITSNYSVTGIGDAEGGVVTYPMSGTPINSDTKLLIYREMDMTQQTNFSNQGGFFPKIHETAFDTTMMVIQQVQEQLDRSVVVPLGSEVDPEDLINSLSEAAVQAQDARDDAQESAAAASGSAASAADSAAASASSASAAQAARDAIPAAGDILTTDHIGDAVEAHDPAILKADTPATLTTGYAETPLAITSGATINVLAGSLRIASPPTGFTVGPMNSVGRVTILIIGGTSFAYDASYDFVIGTFDATKSGHAVQVINTGTTRWIIIVPSEE